MKRITKGAWQLLLRVRLAIKRALSKTDPALTIGFLGPEWLRGLVANHVKTNPLPSTSPDLVLVAEQEVDQAKLLSQIHERGWSDVPAVGYRADMPTTVDPSPFVEAHLFNPLSRRESKELPPDFHRLADDALRHISPWPQHDSSEETAKWLTGSLRAHVKYRVALTRTSRHFVSEMASSVGLPEPASDDSVTVACVTNRPDHLGQVIDNYRRQVHENRRLLVVANSDQFDTAELDTRLSVVPNGSWIQIPERMSLGYCLNTAMSECATRFLAKFDDDDYYGSHYLSDSMLCHQFTNAAVIGKHSYFFHSSESDVTAIRFPDNEFRYTSFVAGGTLLIDCEQVGDLRFEDRNTGEDTAFLISCQRAGKDVFSSDCFNYLQTRGTNNTWQQSEAAMLRKSMIVSGGRAVDLVDV